MESIVVGKYLDIEDEEDWCEGKPQSFEAISGMLVILLMEIEMSKKSCL